MKGLISLLWICLFIISVQSYEVNEDEDFKLYEIEKINYTINSPIGFLHPVVRLFASKIKGDLSQLKKDDSITLVCTVEQPQDNKAKVGVILYKRFKKTDGDHEYKILGGPLNVGESPAVKLTGNRYKYPKNYKSYEENDYGGYLRFTMTKLGPDDMGDFACKPEGSFMKPNKHVIVSLNMPYLPIESTKFQEIEITGNETIKVDLEKESPEPILIVKSDTTKRLQYTVSLKTKEKPSITFDGGEHGKKSPVKWELANTGCVMSKIDVIYQHSLCHYTYTAKFSDFKLKDNGESIRIKATAKNFDAESDITSRTLKIVSKPEFECQGYTQVKKASSGPFNISCSIYMNPLSEDWTWFINEKFELHPSNKTVKVDNNTLTVESSKIDDEYKLELVLSTNEFDVKFLEALDLKIKAENKHGSNEKEISILWAGNADSGCASIASHIFLMVTILSLLMR